MAKVNFRIRSNSSKNVSIKVYLSNGVNNFIETNTGFTINPSDWSTSTKLPKQNIATNKKLHNDLKDLESYIYASLNDANSKSELVDKNWLNNVINECFKRVEKTDNNLLINHTRYIIENASTRVVKGRNDIGLSKNTIKVYQTFLNIISEYQKSIKKSIHFTEINKNFVDKFTNWLINVKKYSINNAGKQIDMLKNICSDAYKQEIEVNPYFKNIEGFNERNEDRYIVTLSFEDLEKIYNTEIENPSLNNARKWILIGCELGQRGGDLLDITFDNVRYIDGLMVIDIVQTKTKKGIPVPVLNKNVVKLIENEFPYKISTQKLNDYIKEVCKIVGISEIIEGKKIDSKSNRKVLGKYPKYELITTHSFRRSYATNYYKLIPTAVLIGTTGHSKESIFLQYINQREDKDQNAKLFAEYYANMNKENKPKLKVVKSALK
jgi:integrase